MIIHKNIFMKLKFFVCMLIISGLIITAIPIQSQSTTFSSTTLIPSCISETVAQEITSYFIIQHQKQDMFSINTQEILYDSSGKLPIGYIFQLEPTGYVVISSSKILPPIVAYSWKTSFPTDPSDPLSQFISFDLTMQLNNKAAFSEEDISNRLQEWETISHQQITTNGLYEQWPPEGSTETEGWIETTWSQDSPYNDFCPIDPDTGERSVAGCPAVAMAQILNYYRTTNNIQFSDEDDYFHNYLDRYWIDNDHEKYDFPSFPELNTYLDAANQQFNQSLELSDEEVAALNFACGVACKQVYSPAVSGTFGVNQAYDAYLRFNCSTAILYTESSDTMFTSIIKDIQAARPVHLAVVTPAWDAGHNLIIDGYNTDNFFHLNFGWSGSHDAWYQLPMDLPYDLTVIEGVIVNIMNQNTTEKLTCEGKIQWQDVTPGEEIQGTFTVQNTGAPGSLLSWKILSVPDWGTWTLTPDAGTDLTPEDGAVTIEVTVIAPDKKNKEFSSGITIVNSNNPGDREFIPIVLQTAKKPKTMTITWGFPSIFPFFSWQVFQHS